MTGHGEFKMETRQLALRAYDVLVAAEAKDYKTLYFGSDACGWVDENGEVGDDEEDNQDEDDVDEVEKSDDNEGLVI